MKAGCNNAGKFLIVTRAIEARRNNLAPWNSPGNVNLNNPGLNSLNSDRCSNVALSHVPSNHHHASLNVGMITMVAEEMAITEEAGAEETDKTDQTQ